MKKIKIFDTTLRDGEQAPGYSMHAQEKLEMAIQLERLGVDVIEAGFAVSSEGDFKSVEEIAAKIKTSTVCSLARCTKGDIDAAYNAIKKAESPRIHVFLATSPIHMRYKLKMSEDEVLRRIDESVRYAKRLCSDVQFSAEDACRSDRDFLVRAVDTAINAGATTVNLPDTVGYCLPEEIEDIFRYVITNVKDASKVDFATHCHDDLGMSVANSLAAVLGGATQIECAVNGIGERAGNASLEEVVMALKTRRNLFEADTGIRTEQIYRTSKLLSTVTGVKIPISKAIVGANAFAHESGIHQHGVLSDKSTYEIISPESVGISENTLVLGKHSGKHALQDALTNLGYELPDIAINELFQRFKQLADRKKTVTLHDVESLVTHANVSAVVKKSYSLDYFGITSKKGSAMAVVVLNGKNGKECQDSEGDGPVDAAFKAINAIIGKDFRLDDYSLDSVSEGKDALGEATLRLSYEGESVRGRGVSTDIVEASILAYINGANKLLESLS